MVFICTALYIEAEPFIEKLNLKKDLNITRFQVFKNDSIILLITGKGKIKSCIALTYLLSVNKPTPSDIIINFGFCGCSNEDYEIGQAFLCNKIIDDDTDRTYYPDILFSHPFLENSIETFSKEVSHAVNLSAELVDMEASAIYESAITFYQPHQVFFIKVISDYLTDTDELNHLSKNIIETNIEKIISWLNFLQTYFTYDKSILSPKEINLINTISNNLKLSATLKNELKQIVKYNETSKGCFTNELNAITQIKCTSKKEGKIYFEKIRQRFV